jgi:sugar/nucleoside kinase (ribokinase family)
LKTLESTIIVSRTSRTILTEEPANASLFTQFVRQRLDTLDREFGDLNVRAVMIGHIYADNRKFNPEGCGSTTRMLIERFKSVLVFTNFGESQYDLGWSFWKSRLRGVDLFQLSMSEVRRFFCAGKSPLSSPPPLREIIDQFQRRRVCAVITLDKYGAIVTHPDRRNCIYIAWPHEIPNLVDPTGAGDAFGAGLVASFHTGSRDFERGLQEARRWAAYACTTVGGAHECPGPAELKKFKKTLDEWRTKKDLHDFQVELIGIESADRLLHVLDKAY